MPDWLINILSNNVTWSLVALLVGFLFTVGGVPFYTWLERRGAALLQMRPGPNRRGPYGLVQAVADAVKMITKEDIVPDGANKWLHGFAPLLFITICLSTYAVIPWSLDFELFGGVHRIQVADLNYGILFMLALSSLAVHALAIAGWASNNKYSLLGGLRAAAQLISYELAMALALVGVFVVFNSVKLYDIVLLQSGSLWQWGIFKAPVAFVIFLVASYAETNRVPFDIVEADSEIVAGYLTEYSGMRFGIFYMGEYVNMVISSVVTSILFFGGPLLPWVDRFLGDNPYSKLFPWLMIMTGLLGLLVAWDTSRPKRRKFSKGNLLLAGGLIGLALVTFLLAGFFLKVDVATQYAPAYALAGVATQIAILSMKMMVFLWLFIWIRWSVPRFRYDQLMKLGWKILLPLGLANLAVTGVLVVLGYL